MKENKLYILDKPVKIDTNNQIFNNAGRFLGVVFTEIDGTKHLVGKQHKRNN